MEDKKLNESPSNLQLFQTTCTFKAIPKPCGSSIVFITLSWHLLKLELEGNEKSNFKITIYYFYLSFSTHFQNASGCEVDYINSFTFLQCECVSFSFSKSTSVSQREILLSSFCRRANRVPNKPWQVFQNWAFFHGF